MNWDTQSDDDDMDNHLPIWDVTDSDDDDDDDMDIELDIEGTCCCVVLHFS